MGVVYDYLLGKLRTSEVIAGEDVIYDNSSSGLAATDVQAAIDELDSSVDGLIGGVEFQGSYNADTNTPDLDTAPSGITKGDMYKVSVAGDFFTEAVQVGDTLIADIDNPTLLSDWTVLQYNVDLATTTVPGIVELATDGENAADKAVQGNDSRLSDTRTPTAHAASHTDGTDDIQDATTGQKGLMTPGYVLSLNAAGYAAYRRSQTSNTLTGNDPSQPQFIVAQASFSDPYLRMPATSPHAVIVRNLMVTALEIRHNDEVTIVGSIPAGEVGIFWLYSTVWYMKLMSDIMTAAERSKLTDIEALADVTDAANVQAAIEAMTLAASAEAGTDEVLVLEAGILVSRPASSIGGAVNIVPADFATATAGDIIAFDSLGDAQYVAAGTAGQVLKSQGADLPVWGRVAAPESTGIITGGLLSVGSPTTTFSISDGTGQVVDNTVTPATVTPVSWTGITNVTATHIAAGLVSYVAIDNTGAVVQQLAAFTNAQRRQYIVIGSLIHVNLTVLDAVNQFGEVAISPLNQLVDLAGALGKFNIVGNIFSANGANLLLNKSVGNVHVVGSNWANDTANPNVVSLPSLTGLTFQYRLQTGTNGATGTSVNPNIYDLAGVSTAVPANKFTIQRIYSFTSNNVKIQPGQVIYSSLTDAKAALQVEVFVTEPSINANGILRGILIVKQGTTSLQSVTQAFFYEAGKLGGTTGIGGQSVSSLQNAYDNSTDPEILTDATRGALTVKRGSAADTDNIIEGQNGAGSVTFSVKGDGNAAANNLLLGYATTATAAGTTTLTVASTNTQYFTGATTQTVVAPVTSTLSLGFRFRIVNLSTGSLTFNSSGSNLIATIPAGTTLLVTCILTSGTTAASWASELYGVRYLHVRMTADTEDNVAAPTVATFRIPVAFGRTGTLIGVRASAATAPTGSVLTIDLNKTGTGTVLSTKLTIDATEKTSTTAAAIAVISVPSIADDDEYTLDFDGVGSTVPGKGTIVTVIYSES